MMLDVIRFFKACNPSKTLVVGNPEDRQYYIDFSPVRGSNIIRELGRTITLSANEPNCQLFTGHIGCGKSTELLRLQADLEKQGFHVVYFESDKDLDIGDVDVSDILLAIARQVSESLEAIQIQQTQRGYFANLFNEIGNFLVTPIDLGFEAELSVGIGKLTAKTKDSPDLRSKLRQYLEPRTNGILEAINQELLEPAHRKLQQQGKQGLVVIVDNLDRVDSTRKSSGRTQPEYLFVDRGDQLKKLKCHLVYTIPLSLIFSSDLGPLTNRFGVKPKILPMVPVQSSDGSDHQQGMALLRQMVLARAFPEMSEAQRLERITEVFDSAETLDRLCRASGGHARNLLVLLYSCLQQEDPPLSRSCLETVIKGYREDLILAVSNQQWDLLRQVRQQKTVGEEPEYQALLRSLFVFEYRDQQGRWFDINPAIAEAKEFQL
ncbi:MAG TPA: ATP-binding protein [Coleofasciculaceae cyanobacterium]